MRSIWQPIGKIGANGTAPVINQVSVRKWTSFEGNGNTGATITQFAKDYGWKPKQYSESRELDWNNEINVEDDYIVIDKNWIEGKEISEPSNWNPVKELTTYLENLFEAAENVGYVTSTWQTDEGKYLPTKGNWDRTAGHLELSVLIHQYSFSTSFGILL